MALLFAYYFALFVDSEMSFYAKELSFKTVLAEEEQSSKIVFLGGSSCAHSVRPKTFVDKGIPCVNMGYHAGAGCSFLANIGMRVAKSNDLVVVAMEPHLLCAKNPDVVTRETLIGGMVLRSLNDMSGGIYSAQKVTLGDLFFLIRPTGSRLFKQFGIALFGIDIEKNRHIDEFGWLTDFRHMATPAKVPPYEAVLSTHGRQLLNTIKTVADEKGIRVVYALPWRLYAVDEVAAALKWNDAFIREVSSILPVLVEDFSEAVCVDPYKFSDTNYHLEADTAAERTSVYMRAIQCGQVCADGVLTTEVLWDFGIGVD